MYRDICNEWCTYALCYGCSTRDDFLGSKGKQSLDNIELASRVVYESEIYCGSSDQLLISISFSWIGPPRQKIEQWNPYTRFSTWRIKNGLAFASAGIPTSFAMRITKAPIGYGILCSAIALITSVFPNVLRRWFLIAALIVVLSSSNTQSINQNRKRICVQCCIKLTAYRLAYINIQRFFQRVILIRRCSPKQAIPRCHKAYSKHPKTHPTRSIHSQSFPRTLPEHLEVASEHLQYHRKKILEASSKHPFENIVSEHNCFMMYVAR